MNKRHVEKYIVIANDALQLDAEKEVFGIIEHGYCDSKLRSSISAFGSAVAMGSFVQAVCAFCNDNDASYRRKPLIKCLYYIVNNEKKDKTDLINHIDEKEVAKSILDIKDKTKLHKTKEEYENAAAALKLVLNAYIEKGEKAGENVEQSAPDA